jgi:hypothetical protein
MKKADELEEKIIAQPNKILNEYENNEYKATALISEDIALDGKSIWLDINLAFGSFKTKAHAEKVASSVQNVVFVIDDGIPKIHVSTKKHDGVTTNYYLFDKDIEFKKLQDYKKQHTMGILVTEDDLEPFAFSLEEMTAHFKHGYLLQYLSYGAEKRKKKIKDQA